MKRIVLVPLLIVIAFSLSGCLVQDDSTSLTIPDEGEKQIEAEDLAVKFFEYNQVDTTSEEINYDADDIIGLFKEKTSGESVTIDPIIGPNYDKNYSRLEDELKEQQTLFKSQDDYNYKLLFEDPDGNTSYYIFEDDGDYTNYTGTFEAAFRVFEEINGIRVLTDNGIIKFEVDYDVSGGPLINHVLIDYRELGSDLPSDN